MGQSCFIIISNLKTTVDGQYVCEGSSRIIFKEVWQKDLPIEKIKKIFIFA